MENKVIKNMEYWKKKNNIPGIEALADSGLTDGRAGSSAFQMASPESSPNKFVGLAAGGMIGAALSRKNSQDEGPQELLSGTGKTVEKVTGFKVSGGEGTDVAGGAGAADGEVAQPVAEDPNTALTMRSPAKQDEKVGTRVGTEMDPVRSTVGTREQKDEKAQESETPAKQEEMMMDEKPVDPTEKIYVEGDYKEGDLVMEDDLESQFKRTGNNPKDYPQLSVQDYSEIRVDEKGMYVQKLKKDEEIKGLEMGGVGEIKPGM